MQQQILSGVRVAMVSLGCAKNQIDSEMMLATLDKAGCTFVPEPGLADVVVINTCGFIRAAKEEAIENILECAALKNEGRIKGIVVTGCMAERYKKEIINQLPEADAFVGIGSIDKIDRAVASALCRVHFSDFAPVEQQPQGDRILSTPPYTAYLRVADGCDNRCAYCAIPQIRGAFRSRPMEELVNEARQLALGGVKELTLIAQDTTRYGVDLYGEIRLPELLRQLEQIDGLRWIRILYGYPDEVTDELLDVMKNSEKIVPYLDLPLQHCSSRILKKMNRRGDKALIEDTVARIRKAVPGIVLRTTFITGFPSETEEEFEELLTFLREQKFDRVGVFAFSPEENTPAADMEDTVPDDEKEARAARLMELQGEIAFEKAQTFVDKTVEVLVEGFDDVAECWYGRTALDAPEVDGKVFFAAPKPEEGGPDVGSFVPVFVTEAADYDLYGELAE